MDRDEHNLQQNVAYKARSKALRTSILRYLGGKCVDCGYCTNSDALQIDHVFSDGSRERKVVGTWAESYLQHVWRYRDSGRYQILCANCNWIKRMRVLREEQEKKRLLAEVAEAKERTAQQLADKEEYITQGRPYYECVKNPDGSLGWVLHDEHVPLDKRKKRAKVSTNAT